eukprot:1454551-Rhodomonas_salina.1
MGLTRCRWSGGEGGEQCGLSHGAAPRECYGRGSSVWLNYPEVEQACPVGGVGFRVSRGAWSVSGCHPSMTGAPHASSIPMCCTIREPSTRAHVVLHSR